MAIWLQTQLQGWHLTNDLVREALLMFNDGKVKNKQAIMPIDMYHWTMQATAPSYKYTI